MPGWEQTAGGLLGGAAGFMVGGAAGAAVGYSAGSALGGALAPSGPGAPPPTALPGPASPGGWTSDQGYGMYDPNTGMYRQGGYAFDPTGLAQALPAQNMWLNFTGQGTSGITDQLDWQIKALQDKLGQMTNPKTGANAAVDPGKYGIQNYLDPKTGKLAEWLSDPDGIKAGKYGEQGKAILDEFMRSTQGSYGKGGFNAWIKDNVNRNVVPAFKEYENAQRTQGGNQQISQQAVQDIQNQIDYLSKQKLQYTPTLPDGSPNPAYKNPASTDPFAQFTGNLGATWGGTMDNRNPWTDQWNTLTQQKIDQANLTPDEYMKKYMGDYANPDFERNAIAEFQKKLGGATNVKIDELSAPSLSPDAAGSMERAMNYQAQREAQGQMAALRQRLGARGMSAMGELAAFGAGQGLIGQEAMNQANAYKMGNDITAQNFGMQATAAGQNNAARIAAAQLGLQGLNTGFAAGQQGFGNALQRTSLANQLQNNWFQQAQQALANSNQMRSEDRAWNVQDYGLKRGENDALYGRTNDQWNRLYGANQQAFQNKLATAGLQNQQAGLYTGAQQQNAGNVNAANVANAQNMNAWQMQQAQLKAAQQNAQTQGLMNLGAAGLNAAGQYWGSQSGQQAPVNPTGNWSTYDPSKMAGYNSYTPIPSTMTPSNSFDD